MLGGYEKKCENQIWFQADFLFESLRVSHWMMPFMKPHYKVLYIVRTLWNPFQICI
jgi:hypothetical protein